MQKNTLQQNTLKVGVKKFYNMFPSGQFAIVVGNDYNGTPGFLPGVITDMENLCNKETGILQKDFEIKLIRNTNQIREDVLHVLTKETSAEKKTKMKRLYVVFCGMLKFEFHFF